VDLLTASWRGTAQVRFRQEKQVGTVEKGLAVSRELSPVGVMETTTANARPALFISAGGEIACLPHAPFPGSGSWHLESWHALTPAEARDFERGVRRAPACETCLAIARNGAAR